MLTNPIKSTSFLNHTAMYHLLSARTFLFLWVCFALSIFQTPLSGSNKPNVIIIFTDDMGYGDMSGNGHPTIKTPHLDRMAYEGQKWTSFYAPAPVCTPSRAGLLTGRYPIRNGMCSDVFWVLFPESTGGLPQSEETLPELLKKVGYKTSMVGKWHLGHLPEFLPTEHGFDSWYGIPYSNDMDLNRPAVEALNGGELGEWHTGIHWDKPRSEYWNVPLMEGATIVERAPDQNVLTKTYTEKSIEFIKANKDKPFFLYLAHSMPHVPLFASKNYKDSSTAGIYGDVIEEIDGSVGAILQTLKELEISEQTLVVFTSDNGPWLQFKTQGGLAGPLRDGKGTTWEGGMRVPTIFWWPESIQPGLVHGTGSALDLFATLQSLTGAKPKQTPEDSYDLSSTLLNGAESPRKEMIYYRGPRIQAIRLGSYKAHFEREAAVANPPIVTALYNLDTDPGERFDLKAKYPKVIAEIQALHQSHSMSIVPAVDQLARR